MFVPPGLALSQGVQAPINTSCSLPAALLARSDGVPAALPKSSLAAGPPLPPTGSAEGVDPPCSRAPSFRRNGAGWGGDRAETWDVERRRQGWCLETKAVGGEVTLESHRTLEIVEENATLLREDTKSLSFKFSQHFCGIGARCRKMDDGHSPFRISLG